MGTMGEDILCVASDVAERSGVQVVDVAANRRGSTWRISIVIDKAGGVSLGDCMSLNAAMQPRLIGLGLVEGDFRLQVDSPGLDRPLKKEQDFVWATGKLVKVQTSVPVEGQRSHLGRVEAVDGGEVVLDCGGGVRKRIPLEQVTKARLEVNVR